jgi:Secretion system C-terminal sorting domain
VQDATATHRHIDTSTHRHKSSYLLLSLILLCVCIFPSSTVYAQIVFDNINAVYLERFTLKSSTQTHVSASAEVHQWHQIELIDARPTETIDQIEKVKFADGSFRLHTNHIQTVKAERSIGMPKHLVIQDTGVKGYSEENELLFEYGPEHLPVPENFSLADFIGNNYNFEPPTDAQLSLWANQNWNIELLKDTSVVLQRPGEKLEYHLSRHSSTASVYEDAHLVETRETYFVVLNGNTLPVTELITTFKTVTNGDCLRLVTTNSFSDYEVLNAVDPRSKPDTSPIQLSIYPNPAGEFVRILVTAEQDPVGSILIIDSQGRVVREISKAQLNEIHLAGLGTGVYHVMVTTRRGVVSKTFNKI